MGHFELTSRLEASADAVWAFVTTPEGINFELGPWLKMTTPASLRGATLADVPVGRPLGRSWLLAFGVLPVEVDALMLTSVGPLGFDEDSSMGTLRRWTHQRRVVPDGAGCLVTDRLGWEGRLPGVGAVAARVAPALFRHRHRRLVARFGGRVQVG